MTEFVEALSQHHYFLICYYSKFWWSFLNFQSIYYMLFSAMPDQYANAECISSAKRVAISRTPCRAEVGIGIGSFCKGFWLVVLLIPCHLTAFPSFCFCLFTLSAEWMRRGIRCRSNHLTCQPIGVCHQMSFNPPEPTQSTHSTPVRSLGWWNMQGKCNHYWFCGLSGTENSELNWAKPVRKGGGWLGIRTH